MIYCNYSTKPPSTKPPINSHPRDGGGCRSVTWTRPNASAAHLMLLRYERRQEQKVDDFQWVDFRKVVGLWIQKSSDFEYKSRRTLSVVPGDGTEVWGKYIWTRESRRGEKTDGCPLTQAAFQLGCWLVQNIWPAARKTLVCLECCFPLIAFSNADIVISPSYIELGEVLHAFELMD
jgi:hypothetical protein